MKDEAKRPAQRQQMTAAAREIFDVRRERAIRAEEDALEEVAEAAALLLHVEHGVTDLVVDDVGVSRIERRQDLQPPLALAHGETRGLREHGDSSRRLRNESVA